MNLFIEGDLMSWLKISLNLKFQDEFPKVYPFSIFVPKVYTEVITFLTLDKYTK